MTLTDPNLIKIRDTNINLVKKGKLRRPLYYAKSYLSYILGDQNLVNTELDHFKTHLQSLSNNNKQKNAESFST